MLLKADLSDVSLVAFYPVPEKLQKWTTEGKVARESSMKYDGICFNFKKLKLHLFMNIYRRNNVIDITLQLCRKKNPEAA